MSTGAVVTGRRQEEQAGSSSLMFGRDRQACSIDVYIAVVRASRLEGADGRSLRTRSFNVDADGSRDGPSFFGSPTVHLGERITVGSLGRAGIS